MTPIYFGERTRRLFGLYTPASAVPAGARARGVIICPPGGQEYLRAHRSMRQLAGMLAAAGWNVLRFDYFGTGDSAGEITDSEVSGWQDDIVTAIDELKDTAGLTRVALVGLRLGGTLAALTAAQRKDVDMLVLWDPIVFGHEFLAEMSCNDGCPPVRQFAGIDGWPPVPRAAEIGGGIEVLGFPITASQWQALEALDLLAYAARLPVRTLIAVSSELASHDLLSRTLRAVHGEAVMMERLDGFPVWVEDGAFRAGAIPIRMLRRIAEWLS